MENTTNQKIKLYFADNSAEYLAKAQEYFENQQRFEVLGTATSALTALESISLMQPDVVVMDIVLEQLDGFELMEQIRTNCTKMPKIIVTSILSHGGFIEKSIAGGANYFMIKPIQFEALEKRILDLVDFADERSARAMRQESKALDEKISNIFLTVGIPAHIKGYQFLREAIKMATKKPEIVSSITKELYPTIAKSFKTSASKVERAIRHAIEVAWNRGKIENINSIFGVKVYNQNEKPTNGEFIALVADKMLMEGF